MNFGFYERDGISRQAERFSAFQGLRSLIYIHRRKKLIDSVVGYVSDTIILPVGFTLKQQDYYILRTESITPPEFTVKKTQRRTIAQ
jgi:hypothetical protein